MVYTITDANWDSGTKFHFLALVLFIAMHLQFLMSLMKQKKIFMKSQPLSICPIVCDKMEQKLSLAKWESSGDVLQPNDYIYHYWTVHLKIAETINFMVFF